MQILFSRKAPSVLLVFISYLSVYCWKLWHSSFFLVAPIALTLLFIGVVQYFVARMFLSGVKTKVNLAVTCYLVFIVVCYLMNVVDAFNVFQQEYLGRQYIRGALVTGFLFLILVWTAYRRSAKRGFAAQNTFLVIFSVISLFSGWRNLVTYPDLDSFHPGYKSIPADRSPERPVVLIVLDEYASSKECFKVSKDSACYDFNTQLLNRGWIVKDDMYSYEGSTIRSLASTFSFNLSEAGTFKDASSFEISTGKLMRNVLYDSLHAKGVEVINWGIVDLGPKRPKQRLYFYPRNFLELLAQYTLFRHWLSGDPVSYNQRVLETAEAQINSLDTRSFMYLHLYMPHSPFKYEPLFPGRGISTRSYLDFRRFTDEQILMLIDKLFTGNRFKVIITGDHGYRDDANMDYHSTFSAFLGFTPEQVEMVKSVQDLGSLINGAFQLKADH